MGQAAHIEAKDQIEGAVHKTREHDSGIKHVTGQARYVDDIAAPADCLAVHIALSPHAHAKIKAMDLTAVRSAPGVICVLGAEDIPGTNDISPFKGDDPLFAENLVEYAGQSLFAVAAETLEQARAAAELAEIDYEVMPALITVDQAMAADSLLEPPYSMVRGDAPVAIEAAPHRLEGRIYVGGQEHFYLEGQAALAVPGEDEDVTLQLFLPASQRDPTHGGQGAGQCQPCGHRRSAAHGGRLRGQGEPGQPAGGGRRIGGQEDGLCGQGALRPGR